jgi:hypothetical protein
LVALQSNDRTDGYVGRRSSINHRHHTACTSKETPTPRLLLCDISDFSDQSFSWLRIYKLPETWKALSSIDIRPNHSPISEASTTPGTFFYPDPSSRITVISIDFDLDAIPAGHSKHVMLVLEESFLRPATRDEHIVLAWSQWGQHCLVRDMSERVYSFGVIGRRLLHLETVEDAISPRSRLRTVEFNLRDTQKGRGSQPAWMRSGRRTLTGCTQPGRVFPRARSNSIDVYNATMLGATEDNLVLFYVRSYSLSQSCI